MVDMLGSIPKNLYQRSNETQEKEEVCWDFGLFIVIRYISAR